MSEPLAISIDGNVAPASSGESVAAAIANAHGLAFRRSVTGEPRGPVCGMGVFEVADDRQRRISDPVNCRGPLAMQVQTRCDT